MTYKMLKIDAQEELAKFSTFCAKNIQSIAKDGLL